MLFPPTCCYSIPHSIPTCWANNAHNRSNFFQIDSGGGKEAGLRSQEIRGRGRSRTQERAKTQDSGETLSPKGGAPTHNTVKQTGKEPFVTMDQSGEMHIKKQVLWKKLTKCRKMTMNTELLPSQAVIKSETVLHHTGVKQFKTRFQRIQIPDAGYVIRFSSLEILCHGNWE